MWGVGGLTFGLSIRYLGIALGYAIALGFCTAFGTLMPPIFSGQMSSILHEASGQVILAGVGVCMLAIAVSGLAGYSKEHEISAKTGRKRGSATSPSARAWLWPSSPAS
jgi:L-rhamnose-H+ transport protein